MKPAMRPLIPNFSSGPCAKRPGWAPNFLSLDTVGRSHRSLIAKTKLQDAIEKTREILKVPVSYRIAIVPASDTGAFEMALWSLIGNRPVDVLAWESFGFDWVRDVVEELAVENVRMFKAPYGELPNLGSVNFDHDIIFCWNGTTSGVRVPNGDWIDTRRKGLTICDATSAAFGMHLPWDKLDVATFSWQKVLGGEAQHGMLVLSPRAVARLESYVPKRPIPKIFRLMKNGKLMEGLFHGETINTPSLLAVEDYLDALNWAQSVGGLDTLIARSERNLDVLAKWLHNHSWATFLAKEPHIRSCTSVCLSITDDWFIGLSDDEKSHFTKELVTILSNEKIAYDVGSYRDAPPGLRIWCGATVESADIEALVPWLDWAYETIKLKWS